MATRHGSGPEWSAGGMKQLVVYHANCADGFTAAWVAWLKYGDNAEYLAAQYGDEPPDVMGRDVLVLDFSYQRETLVRMHSEARSLLVLDHHKTSERDLEGLPFCVFDQRRCGSAMAWEYLKTRRVNTRPPPLIRYVQDRDLWTWELPESKAVSAYIATVPKGFERWSLLEREIADGFQGTVMLGKVALRVVEQYVETKRERAVKVTIGGHKVPCINTTFAISELVGALAEGHPFAAGWFQRDDGRFVYELRSRGEDGADVAEIARQSGGGGHQNAAGFTVDHLLPLVSP